MERLAPDPAGLERAAEYLTAGRLVVVPTETLYGLSATLARPAAVEAVGRAKGRAGDAPLPVLVSDLEAAEALVRFDSLARRLAARYWPGPLTLVLPARESLTASLCIAADGTVGVRVAAHPVAAELCRRCGPLTGTSANPSGVPPPLRPGDLAPSIQAAAAALVDGGELAGGVPSTVVRIAAGGDDRAPGEGDRLEILRAGAIPAAALRRLASRP